MSPDSVVADDPGLDLQSGLDRVREGPASFQGFVFEADVERSRKGVVDRGADPRPRLRHAEFLAVLRELSGHVLRPAIGMHDGAGQSAADDLRAAQCGLDQVGAHVIGDRPPRQTATVEVDHRGQVEKRAVSDRQVREVADVARVRCRRGEVTAETVGHGGRVDVSRWRGRALPPEPYALDSSDPHQSGNALAVDPLPLSTQLGV